MMGMKSKNKGSDEENKAFSKPKKRPSEMWDGEN